jgi:hypothetical protein
MTFGHSYARGWLPRYVPSLETLRIVGYLLFSTPPLDYAGNISLIRFFLDAGKLKPLPSWLPPGN